jgi:hypothetical protein
MSDIHTKTGLAMFKVPRSDQKVSSCMKGNAISLIKSMKGEWSGGTEVAASVAGVSRVLTANAGIR